MVVVVRPKRSARYGLLLAKADTKLQSIAVGRQTGSRVELFLDTDDFESDFAKFKKAEFDLPKSPGKVVEFHDILTISKNYLHLIRH